MKINILDAFLGFTVLLITGLFLFYVYITLDTKLFKSDGFRLHARFENIDGIVTGSKVKLSGVNIGTVKSISLEPESYYAFITMNFDKKFSFPDDTEASVQLEGLLGGSYISILPGGSDVMLLNDQEILYTQGSTSLLNLMLKFANTN
jgi:phospholipid/cholesterol/gamma-HCH transport system substrate-binding protein|tara:strand:+ start:58 stop:501 length:444 start_codon:yes stop_codon:yes gene_type:complete